MGRRSDIDWDLIENDYRITRLTIRALATKYGVAPSSIVRRAKRCGWLRGDLVPFLRDLVRAKRAGDAVAEQRVWERYDAYEQQVLRRE